MTSNVSHERLISTEQDIDVPLGPRHAARPNLLDRIHHALGIFSGCSVIFVLGILMGLQVAR